jgi:3-oxoacyl-[acyl-carrier-protein] synthase-3
MLLETCAQAGIKPDDLDWVLVHQANIRIVEQLQERTGIAPEKWIVNMVGIGNTCSASVLLALGELLDRKLAKPGDHVLLAGFGAGLTWAAALFEWGDAAVGRIVSPAVDRLAGAAPSLRPGQGAK